jgi:hypothetical protein
MNEVKPEFIQLGRELLTRIDGETQDIAAVILGGSIQMTVDAQKKPILHTLSQCEAALRDAEECLPRWEVLSDQYRHHCLTNVIAAAVAAKAALASHSRDVAEGGEKGCPVP